MPAPARLVLFAAPPIPGYELAIVDLVRRRLPDLRSYHEIGSGLGIQTRYNILEIVENAKVPIIVWVAR